MLFKNQRGIIPEKTRALKVLAGAFVFLSAFALSFIEIPPEPPAPGVVTALGFNEGSGVTATDISGNSHNGTLTNSPTWVAGKYGQGVNVDGTNEYVNIADHANFTLDPALNYTWSAWVKNNNFNEWGTVWSQTLNASNFFYFYAHTSGDLDGGPVTNGVSVYWWTTGGANQVGVHSTNNVLTVGQWSHIAVTYNAAQPQNNRFSIYVNGVDVTVRTDVASAGALTTLNPTSVQIGANQPFGDYVNAAIDEVRYYRRLLTLAEIQSDMNTPVEVDNTAPTVNITAPAAGSVAGTINVDANATDNVGVAGVQFLLDGANLGAEDITAPYSVSWNTTTTTNGSHSLTARARDAAGNTTTSSPAVTVTVNNDITAPTVNITAPAAGNVSGTVNVDANASDNVGVVGVQFLLNGANLGAEDITAPYSVPWNTLTSPNGNYTLTARARDAAGNTTTSSPGVVVTVSNAGDGQAPTVSLTAPSAGTVSGTVNVSANASDNVGVVGVQFLLNGANLGAEDITAPYTIPWNTLTSPNGSYTLTARARDAAGNNTTSSPGVVVTVSNNSNLTAALSFNEGSGVTATDISGNSHNGTLTNTPTWVAGKYGQGVNVDGTNEYINIVDHANFTLDPTQSYTWSAWVKNNNFNEWGTVWSQTINTANFFYFYAHTTGHDEGGPVTNGVSVYWWVNNGASLLGTHSTNNVLTVGQWSHIAVTYNAAQPQNNRFTIYVNGVDVTVRTDVASIGTITTINPTSVQIGANQPYGNYINAAIDEVRYYRRLLTQLEVQTDMNTPVEVDNTAPTVNITAPAAGSVAGTINVDANASDNVGVAGVQFLLDGANLGAEDITAPYSVSWNTTTTTNGSHSLTARARDAAGNTTTSSPAVTVTVNNDITAPTVNITAPAAGNVSGTVNVDANASDNVGVVGVQFLLNGANLGAEDITAPYSVPWNTTTVTDGNYTLTARARDAAGNTITSSPGVAVNVLNNPPDGQAPTVNITAPAAGSVAGTINVDANATDNVGVAGVQFLLDGANLGAEDITAPYSVSWNTTTTTNGSHSLTARARDAAGNTTTSSPAVTVTVNNDITAPTVNITAPAAGNVSGTVNVDANASDNVGVVGVQFLLNGANLGAEDITAPYSVPWNTLTSPNGNYTLTARARDAAGNTTTSSPGVVVTVSNAGDGQAPTVSLTAPSAGTVSGTVNVSANASDNVGVVGVQFLLNGANLGAEDITAPYTIPWNTLTSPNGSYTLTARARDAAGNNTTSSPGVVVTVSNNSNLTAALSFNEGSGVTATDISGNSHNGTLTNTPTWVAGKYGQGVNVDGTNEYINIVDHANFTLDPTQSYTWSAWVKNNNFNEWGTVWSQTINTANFFYFYAHTTGHDEGGPVTNGVSVYWWVNNGASLLGTHSTNNVLTVGQWSHIAVTYNAAQPQNNRFTIYVNGVDVTVRTDVASIGTITTINPTSVQIGANQPYGNYINAAIDEVRYYRRLLTQLEVQTDMNTPVEVDNTAPTVNITAPAAGSVAGTINVDANASDNVGVAGVQFLLDGANLGAEDITAPYSVSWNTTTTTNGSHSLTARARDAAGNTTTSSPAVTVTVNNDITAPTVNITAPAAGNVSGTVNVDANASDNVGVVGVQFLLNGANLGAEDITAPYSVPWNTLTSPNGNYTLTARARDAAGNTTTSSPGVVVTVSNAGDGQAPTVSLTAPSAGIVSGTVNVSANASDNVGVVGVQFLLNGANLGAEDLSAPYTISWNTLTSLNGSYTLTARARDAAGNNTTSSPGVVVTVTNNTNLITALSFNEGSGVTATDISGNSHNGTLTNTPTWVAGKYGQGVNLDGTNEFVSIADHANFTLDPTQSYTWSAWVKNNNFNEWGTVWSQTLDASNFFYFYAHTSGDLDGGPVTNGVSVYWWTNGGASQVGVHSSNNVLSIGQWSHIAVAYNAAQPQNNRFSIYVNGVDVTVRTDVMSAGALTSLNPTSIRIGGNQPFGDHINAAIDEVRFYRRLLTQAEVQTDMNTPIDVDNTAPTVAVTLPVPGNISGTVNVTANASDNIGVAGVQFLLDGANLGAEDITAPYSVSWNTATATNGNHTLSARARDAAGNTTTSAGVVVTVVPDFTFTLQNPTRQISSTGSTDFKADIVFLNGFTSSNIALTVTGFPAGVSGSYSVNPMTGQGLAQLNVTSVNAVLGSYPLTLSATANGTTRVQQATLIVAGPEDFALAASPIAQSVVAGNATTYTITLSETNDFINPVTLSVLGLPAGVTASFNPTAPTPAATSILTLTTSTGTVNGTYNLTVRGISGAFTRTTPVTLTVSSIPPSSLLLPPGFNVINVGGAVWDQPMGTTFTGNGQKMFVWEKQGIVYVCNRNAQQLYDRQNTPVINISEEVGNWDDFGLMSIALDPNFSSTTGGYIYLLYVVDRHHLLYFGTGNYNPSTNDYFSATIGRVTRYKVIINGNGEMVMDPSPAERKILIGETKQTGIPNLHLSHGPGTIIFASDGTLLISTGDGASYNDHDIGNGSDAFYAQALADGIIRSNENVGAFRAQILNSHNGKLLRIDPATGDGISSNPFYDAGVPRSPRSRVWALGLRNPFRITIKPGTGSTNPDAGDIGEIYIGDVLWNGWEELNIINEPGVNCGWPLYEGHDTQPGYFSFNIVNQDEPNPLAGGSCPQYFQFKQLLKQATADGVTTLFNPCNPSIPIPNTSNNKRFFHHRPALDWMHGQDVARVGKFTGNTASTAVIGTPESGVIGTPFMGNCSIGGSWYTGTLFPESYRNTYFHGEFGARWIKNFKIDFTDVVQEVRNFASGFGAIISIAENPADGTIYCVDLSDNTIKRISYGGNQFPVVVMSSDKTFGPSALTVDFNGSTSFDPDGGPLTYLWNFGDNTTSTQADPPPHVFTAAPNTPTKYVVKLTVTDNLNATATDSIIISVNNTPPTVNITSPVKNSTYKIGPDTIYTLSAIVIDAQHSPGQLKYQWQTILRHNNHEHPGPIDTVKNTTSNIARIGCNGDDYYYLFRLKVTDAAGLSTLDSSMIFPDCSAPRLSSFVLHEFDVLQKQEENLVKWVTERDINVSDFEVEVSSDGYNFFTINGQQAKNTAGKNEYSFLDRNTLPGESYYRLSFLENGSVIGYSKIIKVFREVKHDGLLVSPNPVTGNFLIKYNAVNKGPVTIRFTDVNGNVVNTVNKTAEKGKNSFYMPNYPEWKAGVYLISVHQGKNTQRTKLLYHKPG